METAAILVHSLTRFSLYTKMAAVAVAKLLHHNLCIFHYSPKKAEKLAEIQAELDSPEIKMQKPIVHTRWLACETAIRATCASKFSSFSWYI